MRVAAAAVLLRSVAVVALCALLLLPLALATQGVDVSEPTSTSDFECMVKDHGMSFAVVRAWHSYGAPDQNAPASIAAAWAAGMSHVDAYLFPCPTCGNPESQMKECVDFLSSHGVKYGMLWLDIENPAYWDHDTSTNQAFLEGLITQGRAMAVSLGIYSSASQWLPLFGDSYSGASSLPLWYAQYEDPPQVNFDDFKPFGGWTKPAAKQYAGSTELCGAGVDLNWYP